MIIYKIYSRYYETHAEQVLFYKQNQKKEKIFKFMGVRARVCTCEINNTFHIILIF